MALWRLIAEHVESSRSQNIVKCGQILSKCKISPHYVHIAANIDFDNELSD